MNKVQGRTGAGRVQKPEALEEIVRDASDGKRFLSHEDDVFVSVKKAEIVQSVLQIQEVDEPNGGITVCTGKIVHLQSVLLKRRVNRRSRVRSEDIWQRPAAKVSRQQTFGGGMHSLVSVQERRDTFVVRRWRDRLSIRDNTYSIRGKELETDKIGQRLDGVRRIIKAATPQYQHKRSTNSRSFGIKGLKVRHFLRDARLLNDEICFREVADWVAVPVHHAHFDRDERDLRTKLLAG